MHTLYESLKSALIDPTLWVAAALMFITCTVVAALLLSTRNTRRKLESEVETFCNDPRAYLGRANGLRFQTMLREYHDGLTLDQRSIHSTAHLLDIERILGTVNWWFVPFGFLAMAPGVLTALGILGTFFGISGALGGLSFDEGFTGNTLNAVVGSLSSAFWTSIMGVGTGVLVGFFARKSESRMSATVSECNAILERRFQLRTPEADTDRVLDELATVRSAIQDIPRNLKSELNTLSTSLFAPILQNAASLGIQAAQAHTASFVQQTVAEVTSALQMATTTFSSHMNDVTNGILQASHAASQGLGSVATAVTHMHAAIQSMAAQVASLGPALGSTAVSIGQTTQHVALIANGIKDSLAQLDAGIDATRTQQANTAHLVNTIAMIANQLTTHATQIDMLGPQLASFAAVSGDMAGKMEHSVHAMTSLAAAAHAAQQQYAQSNARGEMLVEDIRDLATSVQNVSEQLGAATRSLTGACAALQRQPESTASALGQHVSVALAAVTDSFGNVAQAQMDSHMMLADEIRNCLQHMMSLAPPSQAGGPVQTQPGS